MPKISNSISNLKFQQDGVAVNGIINDANAGHYLGLLNSDTAPSTASITLNGASSAITAIKNDIVRLKTKKILYIYNGSAWEQMTDVPSVPTVNNSTISFTKNSKSLDSFTLNQSSNKTIAIGPVVTDVTQNGKSVVTFDSSAGTGVAASTPVTKISLNGGTASAGTADSSTGDRTVDLAVVTGIKLNNTSQTVTSGVVSLTVNSTTVGLNNLTNDKQVKGLSTAPTNGNLVKWGADGYTVADAGVATETSLTASSNAKIPTSKAVADYVTQQFATVDAMVFKGTIGTGGSAGSELPTSGYSAGWTYRVITAGTYAGQTCEVGDLIICVKDYASAAADSDWTVVQTNIDGYVTSSTTSTTNGEVVSFDGTTGKIIKGSSGKLTADLVTSSASSVTAGHVVVFDGTTGKAIKTSSRGVSDTYSSTSTALVSGKAVLAALQTLDVTGASGIAASKTISAWSETDGKVSISTQDISITTTNISNVDTKTVATAINTAAPGSTAPSGTAVTLCEYDSTTETLSINQVAYATQTNMLHKSS